MEKFNKLKSIISEMETDVTKFYQSGNNAAGTRIRKTLQEIKRLSQEIRTEIQAMKKSS